MSQLNFAPVVVAQRIPLLWLELCGFSSNGRRESERMVTEKMEAVSEGTLAAGCEMISVFVDIGAAMMLGQSPTAAVLRGYERVTNAAVKPAAEHVTSNISRLSAS